MCLERLLAIARDHFNCQTERPRIEGDAIVIPFDCREPDGSWTIRHERARNRRELLDALGY